MNRLLRWIRGKLYGYPCPECGAQPDHLHESGCSVGELDGGIWA